MIEQHQVAKPGAPVLGLARGGRDDEGSAIAFAFGNNDGLGILWVAPLPIEDQGQLVGQIVGGADLLAGKGIG